MLISLGNLQEGYTYEINQVIDVTPSLSELVDANIKDKILLQGKFVWINEELILKLTARYNIYAACDLCGELTNAECYACIEEILTTQSAEYIQKEDAFDIGSIINESILLALVRKVRCRADCKGKCASCGKNLNRESCSCIKKEDSNPFGILKHLINTGGAKDGITKKKNI